MPVRRPPRVPQQGTALMKTKFSTESPHGQAHDRTERAVEILEQSRQTRSSIIVTSLVAGPNVVNHGLGRTPRGCHVTPTTASVAFAWALTAATPTQATITTVGPTQTNAPVEFY